VTRELKVRRGVKVILEVKAILVLRVNLEKEEIQEVRERKVIQEVKEKGVTLVLRDL
jgi:hypothetical protein